jgi:hypothetical protein
MIFLDMHELSYRSIGFPPWMHFLVDWMRTRDETPVLSSVEETKMVATGLVPQRDLD